LVDNPLALADAILASMDVTKVRIADDRNRLQAAIASVWRCLGAAFAREHFELSWCTTQALTFTLTFILA